VRIVSPAFQNASLGRSIEVNVLGEKKICNFDCVYCSLGPSELRISRLKQEAVFSPLQEILTGVGRALSEGAQSGEAIDSILVSGNGEPTLYPDFRQLTNALLERRSELASTTNEKGRTTKLVCLTNGDKFDDRDIVDALNLFDETVLKIDVGTETSFKKINRPLSRSSLEKIILGARSIKNLSVQTTLLAGDLSLNHSSQLDEWIEVIAMLNPKKVYLQVAKSPTADPKVKLATEDDLNVLSHWLERKLKIRAQVETDFAA